MPSGSQAEGAPCPLLPAVAPFEELRLQLARGHPRQPRHEGGDALLPGDLAALDLAQPRPPLLLRRGDREGVHAGQAFRAAQQVVQDMLLEPGKSMLPKKNTPYWERMVRKKLGSI